MNIKDLSEKEELAMIYEELKRSNRHLKKFVSFRYTFARGVANGVGAFIGATIVITAALWFLAQLQFIPIVGNFALEVVDFVKANSKYSTQLNEQNRLEP